MSTPTNRQLREQGAARLESRLEAELLLAEALGHSRAWLYARLDESLDPSAVDRFQALLERRAAGEPLAYILGRREFYGRDFQVDPSVLIPRPETELLVDLALRFRGPEPTAVADIGTGSGCIALTLAAERPTWRLTATDLSRAALTIAQRNRQSLGLTNVSLALGDLFAPLHGRRYDLIVSNPPYVAERDPHLEQGDLRFEPAVALSCPSDGLAIIRRLALEAPAHLANDGLLLLEHGHDQAASVAKALDEQGYVDVTHHRDLAGIERVTVGRWPAA